jgi:hypothetical protein
MPSVTFKLTLPAYSSMIALMNATSALSRLAQIVAAALIFTGSHAFGQATITQTQSFSGQGIGNIIDTFAAFDTSQGTLTGVTIELSNITSTGNASVSNITAFPPQFGGTGGTGYNEDLTGGFSNTFTATSSTSASDVVTVTITSNTQTQLAVPPGTSPDFDGNTFVTGTLTATQSPTVKDGSVSDLANYLSSNGASVTITLDASTTANASANAGTNKALFNAEAEALANGDVTLIYTYTPVPEPSKTAACMIGLTLCLLVGRNYFKGNGNGFRLA